MNHKDILNASGDKFSRLAGEVLHLVKGSCYECEHLKNRDICNASFPESTKGGCSSWKPIPIDIKDFNIAMKWRDWAVGEFGDRVFGNLFIEVWCKTSHNEKGPEFISLAQPEHYIKAACLCKLGGDK